MVVMERRPLRAYKKGTVLSLTITKRAKISTIKIDLEKFVFRFYLIKRISYFKKKR